MLLVTLPDPLHDPRHMQPLTMVLSGSRVGWWLASCAWVALCCLTAFAGIVAVCIAWGACWGAAAPSGGASAGLRLWEKTPELLGFDASAAAPALSGRGMGWRDVLAWLSCSWLALTSVCLVQRALVAMLPAPVAFSLTLAMLSAPLFVFHPWLVGSHAMLARSTFVINNGFSPSCALGVTLVHVAAAMCLGAAMTLRRDVVGQRR
jgi:hypothetical protein